MHMHTHYPQAITAKRPFYYHTRCVFVCAVTSALARSVLLASVRYSRGWQETIMYPQIPDSHPCMFSNALPQTHDSHTRSDEKLKKVFHHLADEGMQPKPTVLPSRCAHGWGLTGVCPMYDRRLAGVLPAFDRRLAGV